MSDDDQVMNAGRREAVVIEPRRERGEPNLAGPGLLLINPGEARQAGELARAAGWRRYPSFPGALYVAPGGNAWLSGPALGAPLAVMALEKLVALGARAVISQGWCGSLQPEIAVGDVLLPTTALSEEGTSAHYPVAGPVAADGELSRQLLVLLAEAGFSAHGGPVWTTDAPYRETRTKVGRYRRQGIAGVEMEFAALATVAAFRGIPLASVLLVSDQVREDRDWQPAFRRRDFQQQSQRLLAALFAFIARA